MAPLALLSAEAGTAAVLLFFAPDGMRQAGFADESSMLLPHAAVTVSVWGSIALLSWILVPKFWRHRHQPRALYLIGACCLLVDSSTTTYLYAGPDIIESAPVLPPDYGMLALAVLFRAVCTATFFALPLIVATFLTRRRILSSARTRRLGPRSQSDG